MTIDRRQLLGTAGAGLTLGVPGEQGATIYVTPQQEVELGAALF